MKLLPIIISGINLHPTFFNLYLIYRLSLFHQKFRISHVSTHYKLIIQFIFIVYYYE